MAGDDYEEEEDAVAGGDDYDYAVAGCDDSDYIMGGGDEDYAVAGGDDAREGESIDLHLDLDPELHTSTSDEHLGFHTSIFPEQEGESSSFLPLSEA